MLPGSNNYFFSCLFLSIFWESFCFLVGGNLQILGFELLFTFRLENELESLHVKFCQHLSPGSLVPSGSDVLEFGGGAT